MRNFKSSYLGVAGLVGLMLFLTLAPKLGLQPQASVFLIPAKQESPLRPLLGLFKESLQKHGPRYIM